MNSIKREHKDVWDLGYPSFFHTIWVFLRILAIIFHIKRLSDAATIKVFDQISLIGSPCLHQVFVIIKVDKNGPHLTCLFVDDSRNRRILNLQDLLNFSVKHAEYWLGLLIGDRCRTITSWFIAGSQCINKHWLIHGISWRFMIFSDLIQ